jgi:ribosomal protein S18 acetylase RimI-like enzyme
VSVDLRSARPDDFDHILSLWREATEVASSTDDLAGLTVLHRFDPEALIVATDDKNVIGTLIVAFDGWRGSYYRLAVHPAHRGQGVARSLVAEGEARLARRGCRRISLFAVAAHEPAVAFWKAVGYRPDPEEMRFVANLGAPRRV